MNEIGREYREHVSAEHPVQDHDLKTTRWHDGLFVRCEPLPERARPRQMGRRKTPPAGHGLKLLVHLDERESDDGPMGVFCTCGFKDVAPHGRSMAMAMLEWHWARTHRLQCPFCDWSSESDLRDSIERHMAVHIGVTHPERFPWGYESATEPLPVL